VGKFAFLARAGTVFAKAIFRPGKFIFIFRLTIFWRHGKIGAAEMRIILIWALGKKKPGF
jgi:hypothetical protein